MSRLDELIQEYCPNGVEYKTLEEICRKICSGGTPNSKNKEYYGGNIPWLRTQEIDFGAIEKTGIYITDDGLNSSSAKWIPAYCIIVAMYGATVGKVGYNTIPLTTNQACCNLEIDEKRANYKYVFYCLCNQYEYIKSLGQGSQTNINAQIVKNLVIPVPPLPVQREIVRILDNFTELTAELTAELAARKKQYEYYRNTLLTFNKDIKFERLGVTCNMKSGKAIASIQISPEATITHPYQCFGGNGIRGFVTNASHHGEFPIIGRQGALCGNVNYAIGDFYATEHAVVVESKGAYLQRFLYYLLSYMNLNQYKSQGAQPGLAVGNLENLIAPVPPLSVQKRLVHVLDNFDTICSDLNIGLPAEIEARQKQYEYYRDKLLSFRPLSQS